MPPSPGSRLRGGVLSTDVYQLTMAQLYLRAGLHERTVRFEHFYRSNPDYGTHQAGFCVAAGLAPFAGWMAGVRATPEDVEALRGHRSSTGSPLFGEDFLRWVADVDFAPLRLDAVAEGRVVHPGTPITVVEGPLALAQLIETPLLNRLNFPTLIATKAARVVEAAQGRPVIEFGMRRAPAEGADSGSRAAIVGGAVSTSNAAVGYELGLDPAGTHAHSMVQLFMALGEGEEGAFAHYAETYPDDCLLLVDTIDTLGSGVPNAITTFERLRRAGHEPIGIRLDSGDLAYLAVQSACMLDRAGFERASIVLSSQLDEITVWQIMSQIVTEARRAGVDADRVIGRLVLGVGSRLASSHGDPTLDGVYKLVGVRDGEGTWVPAVKRSDTPAKVLNPGRKRLWRLYDHEGTATADVVSTDAEVLEPGSALTLHHHALPDVGRVVPAERWSRAEELLATVVDGGEVVVDDLDDLEAIGLRRQADLDALDPGVRRLVNPHEYHVSITPAVREAKRRLLDDLGV